VEEQAARIRESNTALIDGLSSVIEHRSLESGQHIRRIRGFTRILLRELAQEHPEYGMNEHTIDVIASASTLHDIGKIAIEEDILLKPGPLTTNEFEVMKTHAEKGFRIINASSEIINVAKCVLTHHEKWDGSGYPYGKAGEDIPLSARIVALADVLDVLTSKRPYKKPFTFEESVSIITESSGKHFDPYIIEVFSKNLSKIEDIYLKFKCNNIL